MAGRAQTCDGLAAHCRKVVKIRIMNGRKVRERCLLRAHRAVPARGSASIDTHNFANCGDEQSRRLLQLKLHATHLIRVCREIRRSRLRLDRRRRFLFRNALVQKCVEPAAAAFSSENKPQTRRQSFFPPRGGDGPLTARASVRSEATCIDATGRRASSVLSAAFATRARMSNEAAAIESSGSHLDGSGGPDPVTAAAVRHGDSACRHTRDSAAWQT